MSIASELTNLESNIGDAYDAVNDMSGIIPQHKNMANLDQAIRTIPQSTGPTPGDGVLTIQQNGTALGTFSANQSTNTTVNITSSSKTVFTWENGAMRDEEHNVVSGGDVYMALQSGEVEVVNSMSSLIIEYGQYAQWSDPTYGTLIDVFFFTVERTSIYGTMTLTQYLYDETNGWLAPREMNIQKRLTAGSITKTYLDPDLQVKELVFEYEQENNSSSTVTVDVPIDFATYEAYYFDMIGVGTDATREWGMVQALDGSKSNLSTEQFGIEQVDSATLNGVARGYTQLCACGWQMGQLTYIELTLRAAQANDFPWPGFKVMAQGATRTQMFQGSIKTSSATVKYIRFNLIKPAGNGFTKLHAYATRRRS